MEWSLVCILRRRLQTRSNWFFSLLSYMVRLFGYKIGLLWMVGIVEVSDTLGPMIVRTKSME